MQFKMQFQKFIIALIKKRVERSPLKYKATPAISCINPSLILYNRMTNEARMTRFTANIAWIIGLAE